MTTTVAGALLGREVQALIPADARLLADRLFSARFVPNPEVAASTRASLTSRDIIRVADQEASGALEASVLRILWLISQTA